MSDVNIRAGSVNTTSLASHYEGNWSGACSLNKYRPGNGISGAAIAAKYWYNAAYCGACLQVQALGGKSVIAMVSMSFTNEFHH
jgi:hypothetical protein